MKIVHLTVAMLFVLTAACGGSKDATAPAPISASGVWLGAFTGQTGTTTVGTNIVTLTLVASTGSVTGNGNFLNANVGAYGGFNVVAAGTYSPPSLALTLTSTSYQPISLIGTVYADSITGTLNGSGLIDQAIHFARQ